VDIPAAFGLLTSKASRWRAPRRAARPDGQAVRARVVPRALRATGGGMSRFVQARDPAAQAAVRRRAAESRRRGMESQQWLRTVVANAPVSFPALDRDGRVLFAEGGTGREARARLLSGGLPRVMYRHYAGYPEARAAFKEALAGRNGAATIEARG